MPSLISSPPAALIQLMRYGIVSAMALGADMSIFLGLTWSSGVRPALAGVIGYSIGLILHFVLSTGFVFDAAAAGKSFQRLFAEFAATGLAGVAITWSVIRTGTDVLALSPVAAKLLAIGLSFVAVFVLRRSFVFRPAAVRA